MERHGELPPGTDFWQGAKFGQLGCYARGNVDVALSEGAAAGARGSGGLVFGADDGGVLFEGVAGCAVTGSGGDDYEVRDGGKVGRVLPRPRPETPLVPGPVPIRAP